MAKETEIAIRKFKNSNNDWWVGYLHFTLLNQNITFVAGGIPTEEHFTKLKQYLKRNKITFNV